MAKAQMQPGTRVHVEPVGVNAEIISVVPIFKFGDREPEKIYYDCGLGRLLEEMELLPLYESADI